MYNNSINIKNKRFVNYCHDGNLKEIKKGLDDSEIDPNWDEDFALVRAIENEQIEVVELFMKHPRVKTDYENRREHHGNCQIGNDKAYIKLILNPFTYAMRLNKYNMMDLLINVGNVNVFRIEYLNILLQIKDKDMINYFQKITGFVDFIIKQNNFKYFSLISQQATDIFLF